MSIYRLYSGDDGQSHVEKLSIADHPGLSEAMAVSTITFREWLSGHFIDWHPAPRRQYIISLSGHIQVELGDGTTHTFNPGDARLVEDLTGQGHITRVLGDAPAISAVIPLA